MRWWCTSLRRTQLSPQQNSDQQKAAGSSAPQRRIVSCPLH
jgi:hypothetical protein